MLKPLALLAAIGAGLVGAAELGAQVILYPAPPQRPPVIVVTRVYALPAAPSWPAPAWPAPSWPAPSWPAVPRQPYGSFTHELQRPHYRSFAPSPGMPSRGPAWSAPAAPSFGSSSCPT